jgi:hypothetical protein
MSTDSYTVINKLNEALSLVSGVLSETQRDDIRMYIKVGEWKLGLETLCEFLYEEELPLPSRAYELIQELGTVLKLDSNFLEMIKPQVSD